MKAPRCYKICKVKFHLKQQYHRLPERLEIVDVVQSALVLDMHEERHPEYCEDKHHQKQQ